MIRVEHKQILDYTMHFLTIWHFRRFHGALRQNGSFYFFAHIKFDSLYIDFGIFRDVLICDVTIARDKRQKSAAA